jgi:outer membrane autotransporter protein
MRTAVGTSLGFVLSLALFAASSPAIAGGDYHHDDDYGKITIKKETSGGFGTFSFDVDRVGGSSGDGTEILTTSSSKNPASSSKTKPVGNYIITENLPEGWELDSVSCSCSRGTSTYKPSGSNNIGFELKKNADVVCTFKNKRKTGQLKIIKSAPGGGYSDKFDFKVKQGGSTVETVDDLKNGDNKIVDLAHGSYSVEEANIPGGWSFSKVNCGYGDKTTNPVTVDIAAGGLTTCTFTNTKKKGKITIIKKSEGGYDKFNFDGDGVSDFDIATSQSSNPKSYVIDNLDLDKTYKITEQSEDGWTLTGINCSAGGSKDGDATAKITLNSTNKDVTCTFTNTKKKKGKITVIKKAIGGSGTFAFSGTLGNFSIAADPASDGQNGPISAAAGDYTISEAVAEGWSLIEKKCVDKGNKQIGSTSNNSVSFKLDDKGDDSEITCTFTNKKNAGKLKIIKNTDEGDGTFKFDLSGGTTATKEITTSGQTGSTGDFFTVNTGALVITETSFGPGYHLNSISCSGGAPQTDVANNKVSLSVAKNDEITCTFNNKKDKGKVKIIKNTDEGDGTFKFDLSGDTTTTTEITTSGQTGSTNDFLGVNTGALVITETSIGLGYHLDSISCSGGAPQTDVASHKVSLTVAKNDEITCTFNNKKDKGKVKIIKNTDVGDGTFKFDLSGDTTATKEITTSGQTGSTGDFFTVNTGALVITETSFGPDYHLDSINCSGGAPQTDVASHKVSLTVAKNDEITCTFNNKKDKGKLTIVKKVQPADGTSFSFAGTGPGGSAVNFSLTNGDPGQVFTAIGPYTIVEDGKAGYTLTDVDCDKPVQTESKSEKKVVVDLKANDNITCTFTNTRDTGDLKISKVVVGGNDTFNFLVVGSGSNSNSFTLTGGQSNSLTGLPTGEYTITETNLPDGWTLQSISDCGTVDLAGKKVTVNLSASGAKCTFKNFKKEDDTAEDETKRFIQRRVDNLLTYGPDRARMLRRLQEQPPQQSLKDGPLKFSGTAAGSAGPMMVGRSPMGLMSPSLPGVSLGASPSSLTSGAAGLPYTGPFKYDGVTYFENAEADYRGPLDRSSTPSLLGQLAGQLMPLASGETSFKFGTSLSEIRATAAAAEAENQRAKLEQAGLSLAEQPYVDRFAAVRQGFDVWLEGHIAKYDDDIGGIGRDGDFRILYVGADYVVAPGVLIGALVQVDDTTEDIDDPSLKGRIEGTGWMAGPYVGVRLSDDLFFDARAAWGQSDNDIALNDPVVGSRAGNFETDRWLASATLTGNEYFGPWRLSPQVQVSYGNEESDAYTTSLGQSVSSTEATIGRLTGTLEVGYRTELGNGMTVEPHVSVSGIWNFDSDALTFNGIVYDTDEARAKIEGGIIIQTPEGLGLRWAGSYDGLGSSDYNAYSGSLWVNVPLN